MQKISEEMLADIDKDTVDFSPNFDGTTQEPVVLPSRFPNLLVNGSSGIAVGMATNMPPHNMGEIVDACLAFIENPEITAEELKERLCTITPNRADMHERHKVALDPARWGSIVALDPEPPRELQHQQRLLGTAAYAFSQLMMLGAPADDAFVVDVPIAPHPDTRTLALDVSAVSRVLGFELALDFLRLCLRALHVSLALRAFWVFLCRSQNRCAYRVTGLREAKSLNSLNRASKPPRHHTSCQDTYLCLCMH